MRVSLRFWIQIHRNYSSSINVADLASSANMSISAFHSAFRNVTLESPIQYIKKVRLNKARELISYEGEKELTMPPDRSGTQARPNLVESLSACLMNRRAQQRDKKAQSRRTFSARRQDLPSKVRLAEHPA